jgi:hypothetical protein
MSPITVWPAAGVEVSADRARTWVARAARYKDGVVVELLDPIPGTEAAVGLLKGWRTDWQVEKLGIDPRSPSATLVQPLADGGLPVQAADAHGQAVAHGIFQDLLTGGRLRVRGHGDLDRAARQAAERRLAGASAVDRYQGVDPAPLVASELAVWALIAGPQYPPPEIF